MSPAQPLVLGFVRMSGPPPTTVASLLVRKPTGATADPDKHSVTTQGQPAQRSKTKSSKRSVASVDDDRSKKGEKSITVATSAVVPLTEMSPGDPIPEEAVFPTEADAAAKKSEEAPVKPAFKPSSRNWVTGLVNRPNAGGLRAKSPTTDPNIRRYNYTPESEDYVTREATQTTNAMSRRQARQPTKAPSIMSASESRADVRSLSAGRALQKGPIEGFRTKTGAIISKAYEDSRRRAASRSQSNGPVHERSRTPVYERLYRKSVPPSPVPPLYARPQSSLSTGSKPRSRSVPHKEYSTRMIAPIARQPQAARDVLLAERSSSRASASTGFDSHSMWNRLYDTENGIPADIEAAKAKHSQLQRSARYVAEQRIRSFSEKRPSKAAHRVPTQPEDMPSYARPLKRHLMIGTTTGEVREVDDVVMTPHAINKTFFSGLRDGSTGTPRAKRFDWPEAPLIDSELKPIGEEPERARKGRQPAKGGNNAGEQDELLGVDSEPAVLGSGPRNMGPGRMSVKALAEAKQQREGRSSSRGVSQQQQRQTPNSTNDRSVSRSKSRPRERSGSAIRSRYSQEAIASERKAIKKAKQARQQQDRIGSGGLMKNITSDIIRELQQEHDWLIRQAAKLGLKKVGTRRVSTAPTPLTPKSNSGPSATAPKPAMYSRRLSTASDDNPISASLYVSAESNGFGSSWDAPPSPRRQAAMQHQQQQQAQQPHGKREQKRGKSPAIEQKRGKSPAMDSVASLRTTPFEGLDEWSDELFKVGMMAATGDNLSELSGGTSPGNPSALPYSL